MSLWKTEPETHVLVLTTGQVGKAAFSGEMRHCEITASGDVAQAPIKLSTDTALTDPTLPVAAQNSVYSTTTAAQRGNTVALLAGLTSSPITHNGGFSFLKIKNTSSVTVTFTIVAGEMLGVPVTTNVFN